MSECQEKDALITSEGIETSQGGGAVETDPFEEHAGWGGDTVHPIGMMDMSGGMPCRPGWVLCPNWILVRITNH